MSLLRTSPFPTFGEPEFPLIEVVHVIDQRQHARYRRRLNIYQLERRNLIGFTAFIISRVQWRVFGLAVIWPGIPMICEASARPLGDAFAR
jgi:hypothetical protein